MTREATNDAVTVALVTGLDYGAVTRMALDILGPPAWLGEAATAAIGRPQDLAVREVSAAVVSLARERGGRVRIVKPVPRLEAMRTWSRTGPGERWQRRQVDARAERLTEVLIPRELANPPRLIAISSFGRHGVIRPPLAIASWTAFIHPRDAIAVRLGGTRLNLAAEIALTFAPELYLLAGSVGSRRALIATSDPIAADLVGLAVWQDQLGPRAEISGPWEDNLVQHATELRLGVLSPDLIRLHGHWAGPTELGSATLSPLLERISLRLGLAGAEESGE